MAKWKKDAQWSTKSYRLNNTNHTKKPKHIKYVYLLFYFNIFCIRNLSNWRAGFCFNTMFVFGIVHYGCQASNRLFDPLLFLFIFILSLTGVVLSIRIVCYFVMKTFAWPHHFSKGEVWPIKLGLPRHFLLNFLYQARKVRGHVFVLQLISYRFCLCFYDFSIRFCNCSDNVISKIILIHVMTRNIKNYTVVPTPI